MIHKISRISLIASATLFLAGLLALIFGWLDFLALLPHLLFVSGWLILSLTAYLSASPGLAASVSSGISLAGFLLLTGGAYGIVPLDQTWTVAVGLLFTGLSIAVYKGALNNRKNRFFGILSGLLVAIAITIALSSESIMLYRIAAYLLLVFSALAIFFSLKKQA